MCIDESAGGGGGAIPSGRKVKGKENPLAYYAYIHVGTI